MASLCRELHVFQTDRDCVQAFVTVGKTLDVVERLCEHCHVFVIVFFLERVCAVDLNG